MLDSTKNKNNYTEHKISISFEIHPVLRDILSLNAALAIFEDLHFDILCFDYYYLKKS